MKRHIMYVIGGLLAACSVGMLGQNARPGELWWVNKTVGGVYPAPMRPIWRLSDLKQMHAGQSNWQEPIIKDPEQDATYNSAAPGTRLTARMHLDTHTLFVVLAGEMHFTVEGQQPVTATRGSLVNILKSTIYSYDIAGTQNALWVEVRPPNFKTQYPATGPQPAPLPGARIVKVSLNLRKPGEYTPPNQVHWNMFSDGIDKCQAPPNAGFAGMRVFEDHLSANPLLSYMNTADNKCHNGGRGGGEAAADAKPFNPNSTFGHMHQGPAEWWIVLVGKIRARFENIGELHAVEGDVLYAAPMTWHEMAGEAPSGPSVRLAMGGYQIIGAVPKE